MRLRAVVAVLAMHAARALPLVAILFPVSFLAVALARIGHPFELEWLEGSSLEAARRLLAGRALYDRPNLDYIPQYYTPLYHYVAQAPVRLMGLGFAPLRLISILSTLGAFALLADFVRRETGDVRAGMISAGLYAAHYGVSSGWYDIARVDSLLVFLALAALHAIRFAGARVGPVGGGLLIVAACLVKQVGVLWFLPVVPAVFLADRRRGMMLGATVVIGLGGATLALDRFHEGWYLYYTRKLVTDQAIDVGLLARFIARDLLAISPITVPVAWMAWRTRRREGPAGPWIEGGFLAGGAIAALMGRINPGGDVNALMPLHAGLSLICGLAWARMARGATPVGPSASADGTDSAALGGILPVALVLQFALLAYNPLAFVPTERDRAAYTALADRIASVPGNVFVPFHPYLASPRPGGHVHAIAFFDVVRGDPAGDGPRMRRELQSAFREQRFAAVVVGGRERLFERDLERHYFRAETLFERWPDVHPRSGFPIRPAYLYLPRSESDETSETLAGEPLIPALNEP